MSPSERLEALNEMARTTPIPAYYGGDVVEIGEVDRLANYVALTTAYHDTERERVRLWNAVKNLVNGGVDYKVVYAGDETYSAASGNALHPGWEIWRTRVGYLGRK